MASTGAVDLSWTDSGAAATSYLLERRYQGTTAFTTIATLGAGFAAYTNASAFVNVIYEYQVIASNSAGTAASDIINFTTRSGPAMVTGVTAFLNSAGDVEIDWTNDPSASTFDINRFQGGNLILLVVLPAGTTSYVDTTVSPNTTYTYDIISGSGNNYTGGLGVTITTTPTALPDPPTDFTAAPAPGGGLHLSWKDNGTNATSLLVQRRFQGATAFTTLATQSAGSTSYVDSSAQANVVYEY